jgi:hypothetical protein
LRAIPLFAAIRADARFLNQMPLTGTTIVHEWEARLRQLLRVNQIPRRRDISATIVANATDRRSTKYDISSHADTSKMAISTAIPIICPVLGFMGHIRRIRIDMDQIAPEKLNWIELPAEA